MEPEKTESSFLRILDASINRAGEGIRVVEDYVRMVVADPFLAGQLKQLRHDLVKATESIDSAARIAARDSEGDVGRNIQTQSEYDRSEANGLIQSNMARVQQALRAIEEFSKTIDPAIAKQTEQLRYRAYTIEKAVLTTTLSLQNLGNAKLYVLTDACDGAADNFVAFRDRISQLVDANVDLIQLRDKTLTDRQLVTAGKIVNELTRGSATLWVMNDRADLALAADADGVHLGQDDVTVAQARRIVGGSKVVGVSTHSIEQARAAVIDGANYIGVGPVFESTTKHFESHVGLELVRQVIEDIKLPAFAIGGISLSNIEEVLSTGIRKVAVSSAVCDSQNISVSVGELQNALK
jgi:thiamine-phosphate pyrophosphorylase